MVGSLNFNMGKTWKYGALGPLCIYYVSTKFAELGLDLVHRSTLVPIVFSPLKYMSRAKVDKEEPRESS